MISRIFTASVMLSFSMLAINSASAQTFNVTTHHYDNPRTGWNSAETTLTPPRLAADRFSCRRR
jgi:hypothetical protein